jgi:hypothetical protein
MGKYMRLKSLFGAIIALLFAQAAQAQEIPPPKSYNVSPEGVNVQDGAFVYEKDSLAIGASESALSLSHFYTGGHQATNKNRALGSRWGVNYDIYVYDKKRVAPIGSPAEYDVNVVMGRNSITFYRFGANRAATYEMQNDSGSGTTLTWSATTLRHTYTDRTGTV